MKYTKVYPLIALLFILITPAFAQISNISDRPFHPPLEIPLKLSGNFGELRPNHFHAGIDIKTNGSSGQKILAIADGYVSRIRVSANGYGKAIYIHHPEKGVTSVYGHLKSFTKPIDDYIKERQYQNRSFEIQLFPDKQQFQVQKGELIGYSGNSGRSHGPHLHFEIRKIENQHPINPLQYEFDITDNIAPKIFNLAVYPRNEHSTINGENKKLILDAVPTQKDHYRVLGENKLKVHGSVGFGIRTFDFLNKTPNWCGIHKLELYIDSTLIYKHTMDEFSFSETRYINSLIDYEAKIRSKTTLQKSFVQSHNNLSIYDFLRNDGFYKFTSNSTHQVHYEVTDVHGNTSVLIFKVQGTSEPENKLQKPDSGKTFTKVMPYNRENHFEKEDIRVNFPKNAFYDTLYFEYDKKKVDGENFHSDLHQIHNKYTPVHRKYTLSIKPRNLPASLKEKAFIARIEDDEYSYAGSETVNGFVSAEVNKLGKYVVRVDNEKPTITPYIMNQKKLSFKIKDELSYIKQYNGYIDGEWALFEYDPKNNLLTYEIDKSRLSKGKTHKLELYISDALDNVATYHDTFTIK
ncbi:MAG: M23 family metallopeptidase [Bacteroidales bacterium]